MFDSEEREGDYWSKDEMNTYLITTLKDETLFLYAVQANSEKSAIRQLEAYWNRVYVVGNKITMIHKLDRIVTFVCCPH